MRARTCHWRDCSRDHRRAAKELGPRNIRVNSINPGMIETEGVHAAGFVGSDFQKMVETQAPLGRVGQPDDISPTAVYLASSDSKYMTGETLLVAGGCPTQIGRAHV